MFTTLEKDLERKTREFKQSLVQLSNLDSNRKRDIKTPEYINLVSNLGFTNSKVVKQRKELIYKNEFFIKTVREASESLLFMKNLTDYFGEGTILIKIEDFIHLIKKYNLVCGEFSDYLGVIPDENLQRISECKEKLMNIPNSDFSTSLNNLYLNATRLYKINSISTFIGENLKLSTKKVLNAFNFMVGTSDYYTTSILGLRMFLNTYLNIPENETDKIRNWSGFGVSNGMFIVAPRNEMMNAKKGINFSRQPDDPFICSLSKYGPIIYSRWGKEAADETFKKYEDLFARLK